MSDISRAAPAALPMSAWKASTAYRRYVLVLLLLIYSVNFLDRQIVNILAEPIKHDLGLADWQIGVMTGLAFALFYTILGIPIARVADRGNRSIIIGTAVIVWSFFTMVCGAAQNFIQLVLARISVGVGEAGCTPPAHSLISDYTPKEKRASALAFYTMGAPLGGLIGLAMGGLIVDAYGWRAAFLVAGAPGLILGILVWLTLREPRLQNPALFAQAKAEQPSFKATLAHLWSKRSFWFMALGGATKGFIGYGHAPFTASYFLRVHGDEVRSLAESVGLQSIGFLGLTLGLLSGIGAMASSLIGGYLADRYARNDIRGYGSVPAIASLATIPIYILAVSVGSVPLALFFLLLNALLSSLWYGPVFAVCQGVVQPNMRAQTVAIQLFLGNLIGLGLGPVCVGALSDVLAGPGGLGMAEGLRWALIVSSFIGLAAAYLFWSARRTLRQDIES